MMDRMNDENGFRVLDGVALVMGAAVASVHLREIIRENLTSFGWGLVWCTFTWVSITATGPFLFLVRRFARQVPGYPRVGDSLWALLGFPWLLSALLRSTIGDGTSAYDASFGMGLVVGLGIASLIALWVVWTTWVTVSPEQAARTASLPWTNRVGLMLAIAWPVQCGIGLVVIS
ncbi:hypothetical protein SAMN05444166_1953 [Singulisphaera sp. GP187]|uniref:hypothetical protein n=1 Tax=Singulisphaera sp. GP187 TaxID=1882752 RepID=UPI00092B6979|nr:hypothetical protein [Singulisphaera sp. GP187]SIN99434.1 hypothetical protein SAMN05444166_1953 [Singulisphaera sp. GP187]